MYNDDVVAAADNNDQGDETLTRLKRPILLLCQTAASPLWDRYENANANNNVNDGDNV